LWRFAGFRERIAKNAISGALCVSGCMDDEAIVGFQLGNPVL
jgi:hypothetical protein